MRPSETTPWRSTPCRSDPDDRRPKIRYPPFHPVSQEAGFFSLKGTEVLYFVGSALRTIPSGNLGPQSGPYEHDQATLYRTVRNRQEQHDFGS